ncbi:MAG TPA: low temperature requirement protein A [Anaerolineales bacterium]|nr:low temperature requirement protein A [Anaerolineales bacterium]
MLERIRFRRWWQPPHSAINRPEERRITFLELFYDLVYVVIIAELSHTLAGNISMAGVGTFVFLFIIAWWAWFNGAMYHDLHGNNDIRTRVFTFLQMVTVAAMAVFAHDAMGAGSVGFALAYAAFHLILTWLWSRTGYYDPMHRPLSRPYSLTFLITSMLFLVSIVTPTPWRFVLWGPALLIDLGLLILLWTNRNPAIQEQLNRVELISASAVERFGLFTIIVLGEVIVGVVSGVAEHSHLSWLVGGSGLLGMLIAIGLWWIYFDFVSGHSPIPRTSKRLAWIYLHLPVTMGIAAVGASILNVVEHTGEGLPDEVRWLLVGAIAAVLTSISLILKSLNLPENQSILYRTGGRVTFISGILVVLSSAASMDTINFLLILVVLLLAPVFYGILVWIKVLDARELEL